ncbi:calpain-11-like, partial [Centruroides sculpturatus]|uniref:calpain-11-like n=1 Tax=Centruroides sculpturatus TaxID=218467 RepID=UPI000C6D6C1C
VPTNMSRLTTQFIYSHHPLDITIHSPARETVTFFTLPPGDFIIMPCTNSPNCETKFLLRILMDEHCTIWEVNDDNIIYRDLSFFRAEDFQLNQKRRNVVIKIIEKFPDDVDSVLLLKILRTYWKSFHLLAEKPGLELCRNLIMLKDPLITGKIYKTDIVSLFSAVQFWRTVFLKFDSSHKERISSFHLRSLLMEAGITVSNKVLECLIVRFAKNDYFLFDTFLLALVKIYLAHDIYPITALPLE